MQHEFHGMLLVYWRICYNALESSLAEMVYGKLEQTSFILWLLSHKPEFLTLVLLVLQLPLHSKLLIG